MHNAILDAVAAWGLSARAEQQEAIEHLAAGRDTVLVTATNRGKSLPAQAFTKARAALGLGTTVAIVPLKALARDLHTNSTALGLRCAVWNGDVDECAKDDIQWAISEKRLDLLVITAESLSSDGMAASLLRLSLQDRLGLVWIDEADVAITDGHFRDSWMHLHKTIEQLNPLLIYASTATCPTHQEAELARRLGLRNPTFVRRSSARPNLRFQHMTRDDNALLQLLRSSRDKKTIVFTATAKLADKLHDWFSSLGDPVAKYTGKMSKLEKEKATDLFKSGMVKSLIATCAFGRGVHVADVRQVIFYDPPRNLRELAQQAGRAGRDGKPGEAFICSHNSTEGWDNQKFLIETQFPSLPDLRKVWTFLKRKGETDDPPYEIARRAGAEKFLYGAGANILRILKAHDLAESERRGLKFRWKACGQFDAACWESYFADEKSALSELAALKPVYYMPAGEIPKVLVEYLDSDEGKGQPEWSVD